MQFSVRHWISGRIRLHVPALHEPSGTADQVLAWLRSQKGIRAVRVNNENGAACRS
jgi:hypothetical protein